MPGIVEYSQVRQRMLGREFVSLYHNSGAFGFARDADVKMLGWIGPADGSVRSEMRAFMRQVGAPFPATLAAMLVRSRTHLPGDVWLMPKSHWHFELHDGHPVLLQELLPSIGIDPALLRERNDGSAITFGADEDDALRQATAGLLSGMRFSDFSLVFPDAEAAAICTVHHHQQLWWQTTSPALIARLDDQSTQSST